MPLFYKVSLWILPSNEVLKKIHFAGGVAEVVIVLDNIMDHDNIKLVIISDLLPFHKL